MHFSPISSESGLTRGAFILRGALATASVYGAGAVGPFVRNALAQSDASDSALLDFAIRLETLEANFYDKALEQVPDLSLATRHIAQDIRDHEHQHEATLRETILQLGIQSSRPPKLEFGDTFAGEQRFLNVAKQLEDTGVAAYNGAAPLVFSPDILALVASIAQVEARHAAMIRDLLGDPVFDQAFEKPLHEP